MTSAVQAPRPDAAASVVAELSDTIPSPPKARRPLWQHVVALTLIVVGLVWFIDNGAVGNADEGAMLAQAHLLNDRGEWGTDYWAQQLDPSGTWFPVELSDRAGDRFFPYVKRPAYPTLVATLYEAGGLPLVLVAHALGTVATALAAALLAKRMAGGLVVPTLWIAGLASPLFFDSYQVIAHSLGAAAMTVAALFLVRVVERRRLIDVAVIAVSVAVATSLRTETALYAVALVLGVVLAWITTPKRRRAIIGAGAVGFGAAVGYLGSAAWRAAIVGDNVAPFAVKDREGWLTGRVRGAWNSLLNPQIFGTTAGSITVVVAAVSCIWLACVIRKRPDEHRFIVILGSVAAIAATLRLFAPMGPVPGLFMAAPLLIGGLVLARRWAWTNRVARLLVVAAVAHSIMVLATQYGIGGAGEWGGRFFHVAIPGVVPLAIAGWWGGFASINPSDLRRTRVALGVVLAAGSVLIVGAHIAIRQPTAALVGGLDRAVAVANGYGGEPIVVATHPIVGRMWWEHSLDVDTLVVGERTEFGDALGKLRKLGRPVVLMAGDARSKQVGVLTNQGWDVRRIERLPDISGATYLLLPR